MATNSGKDDFDGCLKLNLYAMQLAHMVFAWPYKPVTLIHH